ncbi:MAG: protein kinase [Pirellulales bacterium]
MISQGQLPNGESQFIDQVIAEYLQAEAEGRVGDRQAWLDRYPSCAGELAEFLEDRERFHRIVGPIHLQRSLSDNFKQNRLPDDDEEGAQTVELSPLPPKLSTTRYSPLRFHARGGMGEIWLAKDDRIGRTVALKKLRPGRENQQLRFFAEAQITGQLEHPSVVPLHDIGVDDAGQPFYVMKFIHGRRLREAIANFHAHKSSADWSDDLEFRRLLETLVSVCNVVAYAHHKGVVHRDIKPDNILLGPYGEVVVVDWGLAKVIGQPDEERGSVVRLSGSGSTATQDGAIVGSPLYMSPEGAKGQPDAVDQASDVYLLGATLYEMLCAQPPRQAASSWELIDLALNSRPKSPRAVDPRVPRPLEAICLKAMAFDKQDRYATPLALAEDIERFLAGAATTAYVEPLWARAGRWVRRHRRGITQAAAAALLLLVTGYAFHARQEAGALAAREEARDQMAEYRRLADEAQFFAANTDAISERVPYYEPRRATVAGEAALAIAEPWKATGLGLPLVDARADLRQSQYALLLLLAQAKLHSLAAEDSPREALSLVDRARSWGTPTRGYFQLRAECLSALGESEAAERERNRAAADATPVTAQDCFLAGEKLRLLDIGAGALAASNASARRDHLSAALEEYRQALRLDPRHYWARFQSGRCLVALGRAPEAVGALDGCVALRPASPWAYSVRGLASALAGQHANALADLDQAMQIDPAFEPAKLNRGIVHWIGGNREEAIADFTTALASPDDKRLHEAALYRGQLLLENGQPRDALADFSAVVAARPDIRLAYWYRALANYRLGETSAGLADVKSFVALGVPGGRDALSAQNHFLLGKSLRNLAQQLPADFRQEPLRTAVAELEAGLDAGPPTADMWQQLGAVRELQQDPNAAIDAYTRGLTLSPEHAQLRNMRGWAYANNGEYELAESDFTRVVTESTDDAEAHAGLGFVFAQFGREDSARREASTAMLAADGNHIVLHNVACIFGKLSALETERRIEYENQALSALRRAVTLSRQTPLGGDADEMTLIRKESSFPKSLRSRHEFQRLNSDRTSVF